MEHSTLNPLKPATFYIPGEQGYIDYPSIKAA
jgi:hypothetical protein